MRCPACGVLIHVTTGLPFGEASSSPSGRKPENAMKTQAALPPVRKKRPAFSGRDTDERGIRQENLPQLPAAASGRRIPATSWLGMGAVPDSVDSGLYFPLLRKRFHRSAVHASVPALHGIRLHCGHPFHPGPGGFAPLKNKVCGPIRGPCGSPVPKTARMPGFHAPFRGTGLLGLPVK